MNTYINTHTYQCTYVVCTLMVPCTCYGSGPERLLLLLPLDFPQTVGVALLIIELAGRKQVRDAHVMTLGALHKRQVAL
jgi:hypothetical protein